MEGEKNEIVALLKSLFLFKKATDAQVQTAAEQFQTIEVSKGDVIFRQGKPAAKFFLVFSGEVEVIHFTSRGREQQGLLKRGDVFGYEMLEYESVCQCTTVAASDVVLLLLDREHMKILLADIPTLNQDLKVMYESYLLSLNVRLPWKDSEEVVYFISRRHWMYLVLHLIPAVLWALISLIPIGIFAIHQTRLLTPLIIFGVDALICLVWVLWVYVDWSNDYSILTNRRLVYQEKVVMLYDSRQETPLNAILSVATETDWWGRQFSFGEIIVRTYAGEIVLPKLANPRQVSALIEHYVARVKSVQIAEQRVKREDLLREKIGLSSQSPEKDTSKPVQAQVQSQKLLHWIATLFNLRYVQGDVIVYRTHWFILLKRTWLQSFLILSVIATIILRLVNVFTFLSLQAVIGLSLILGFGVSLWWLYNYIDWRNDHYVITSEQIVDVNKKPFGHEERRAAPLKNVLSIEFKRLGIIGLFLNFGTVYIRVGESTLTFDYVFNPAEVQRELFSRLAARDYKEKQEEKMAAEKHVADWIQAYHHVITEEKMKQNQFDEDED